MDVNEQERLSNFTLRHKFKVKQQHFYQLACTKYRKRAYVVTCASSSASNVNVCVQTNYLAQVDDLATSYFCCLTFHIHSNIFNNEHKSYPKISVKQAIACSVDRPNFRPLFLFWILPLQFLFYSIFNTSDCQFPLFCCPRKIRSVQKNSLFLSINATFGHLKIDITIKRMIMTSSSF